MGNRFHFKDDEPSSNAHFTTAPQNGAASGQTYVISKELHGDPALFDFVGPADVSDLLQFLSVKHIRLANGNPPFDLWPQTQRMQS